MATPRGWEAIAQYPSLSTSGVRYDQVHCVGGGSLLLFLLHLPLLHFLLRPFSLLLLYSSPLGLRLVLDSHQRWIGHITRILVLDTLIAKVDDVKRSYELRC